MHYDLFPPELSDVQEDPEVPDWMINLMSCNPEPVFNPAVDSIPPEDELSNAGETWEEYLARVGLVEEEPLSDNDEMNEVVSESVWSSATSQASVEVDGLFPAVEIPEIDLGSNTWQARRRVWIMGEQECINKINSRIYQKRVARLIPEYFRPIATIQTSLLKEVNTRAH